MPDTLAAYYTCLCTDIYSTPTAPLPEPQNEPTSADDDHTDEAQPFNPHHPRANHALYPLEHLLFCTDCHEIRCPRCVAEETLVYYCPRCLVERQSFEIKGESNRCPQSCHDCPICLGALTTARYESVVTSQSGNDSYILSCPYCHWSTLDIGITFPKGVGLNSQLSRIRNGGEAIPISATTSFDSPGNNPPDATSSSRFDQLAMFYKSQLDSIQPHQDSPRYIARLLSTRGAHALRQQNKPIQPMREAVSVPEGLLPYDVTADDEIIARMATLGYHNLTSTQQRTQQEPISNPSLSVSNPNTSSESPQAHLRFHDTLRPIPVILRTKRIVRCRTCRRTLVKPDTSAIKTRGTSTSSFVIRELAFAHIPRISVKSLTSSAEQEEMKKSKKNIVAYLHAQSSLQTLKPNVPVHFLATFTNPLYTRVRVTLGTPRVTPGKVHSKITILCPEFELGTRPDSSAASASASASGYKPMVAVTGFTAAQLLERAEQQQQQQQPEAGKVWQKTRNKTTIVLEVVPGVLHLSRGRSLTRGLAEMSVGEAKEEDDFNSDVLEVPIFVRLEYEQEEEGVGEGIGLSAGTPGISTPQTTTLRKKKEKENEKEKEQEQVNVNTMRKELAYWCVLRLGRVETMP